MKGKVAESFDPNNFGFMVKIFLINYQNQDNSNAQDFQYFTVNSCKKKKKVKIQVKFWCTALLRYLQNPTMTLKLWIYHEHPVNVPVVATDNDEGCVGDH